MASRQTNVRGLGVVAAALLSAAVVGFVGGTRGGGVEPRGYQAAVSDELQGLPAATYRELREGRVSGNAGVYAASRLVLRGMLPSPTDPVAPRTEASRASALDARRALRAFDGAPPTIPHAIDARAQPNCMVCHEHGAKVDERIAPQMSHAYQASCTQCHVPGPTPTEAADESLPFARSGAGRSAFVASEFQPLPFGGLGSRAWAKAPPVVPHPERMRERCESCHGVSGKAGLRTPHPERTSCRQCHVADASLRPPPFALASQ